MKKTVKILALFLAIISITALVCACGNSSTGNSNTSQSKATESEVDAVETKVKTKGLFEYYGTSIGGNEIKSSEVTITNTKRISSNEYLVNGTMTMIDVYGTRWKNTFDCTVTRSTGSTSWSAGTFEYRSKSWSKD